MVKRFVLNIILVGVFVFFFDFALGSIMRYFYFKEKSGLHFRTTYSMEQTEADIIVLGSSRANHHYVPEVFEDTLKLSFYNTGRDGNGILYNYAILNSILKRYIPKIIIFEIAPDELYFSQSTYDRLSSLLPYYKTHDEIRSIVQLKSPYEKIKLFSSVYPFKSSFITIIIGNLKMNKQRKLDREGYIPLQNIIRNTTLKNMPLATGTMDLNILDALQDIIYLCNKNNIKLFMIYSPIYAIMHKSETIDLIERLAITNNFAFINYVNSSLFLNNPSYFQDISHLNASGSLIFSQIVAELISKRTSDKED
jgi:hypothetical protein